MYYIVEVFHDGTWDAEWTGLHRALWKQLEHAEEVASAIVRLRGVNPDHVRVMHIERIEDGSTLQ